MARARRLSANRMLVELIENGIQAEVEKEKEFFDLAQRLRSATDPSEVKRWVNRWDVWCLAANAKDRNLEQFPARRAPTFGRSNAR
jgi:hypothetical protein